jgi:hypothetical protein
MEYDIQDWKVKVKIGGLGVMAQLMSLLDIIFGESSFESTPK